MVVVEMRRDDGIEIVEGMPQGFEDSLRSSGRKPAVDEGESCDAVSGDAHDRAVARGGGREDAEFGIVVRPARGVASRPRVSRSSLLRFDSGCRSVSGVFDAQASSETLSPRSR